MMVKPSEILLWQIAEESPKLRNPRLAAALFCVQTINDRIYMCPHIGSFGLWAHFLRQAF